MSTPMSTPISEPPSKVGARIPVDYRPEPKALADKVILVTGASAGIGRSAALAYARHGATVILVARSEARLADVYDAIEAAGSPRPAAVPFDFENSDENAYRALADAVSGEFERLDGLLLNASILGDRRPLLQNRWNTWQQVMQVNVNSQFLTLQALAPLLDAAEAPSVVFTSSGVGRVGKAYWGAYAVSKFATEAMMQILANESESTTALRANAINPGATNTAMRRAAYPGERPEDNPSPDEIMATYLYLMDPASIGISGFSFDAQ